MTSPVAITATATAAIAPTGNTAAALHHRGHHGDERGHEAGADAEARAGPRSPPAASRTRAGGDSRAPAAARSRAGAPARCGAAPSRARPCPAPARARRGPGRWTGTCSRRDGRRRGGRGWSRRRSPDRRALDSSRATTRRLVGPGDVEQEDAVSLLPREQPPEGPLAHDQLGLEDAVLEGGDEAQPDGRGARPLERDLVAQPAMQHVLHRRGVRDHGHRRAGVVALQQQPRVRLLGIGGGQGAAEAEPAVGQEALLGRDHPRVPRRIEVEAARVVALAQVEARDAADGPVGAEPQLRAALLAWPGRGGSG